MVEIFEQIDTQNSQLDLRPLGGLTSQDEMSDLDYVQPVWFGDAWYQKVIELLRRG
jgi:hypothetical protein